MDTEKKQRQHYRCRTKNIPQKYTKYEDENKKIHVR